MSNQKNGKEAVLGPLYPLQFIKSRGNGFYGCTTYFCLEYMGQEIIEKLEVQAQVLVCLRELIICQCYELSGCFLHVITPEDGMAHNRLRK